MRPGNQPRYASRDLYQCRTHHLTVPGAGEPAQLLALIVPSFPAVGRRRTGWVREGLPENAVRNRDQHEFTW